MAIFDLDQPLMIPGAQTSIKEATARVHYPLYRPIGETPSQVWVSDGMGEAGLRYGSTLVILYSRWQPGTNVLKRYEQQAASWKVGYTTIIGGNPAWVVPQDAQSVGSPPVNVVLVSIEDVEVTLLGRILLPDLLRKAERLQA